MKIAILEFAGQGQAAYEYWNAPDNQLTICDRNPDIELPEDADTRLGEDYLLSLHEFDLLVRTPALHPRDIAAANPDHPEVLTKVTTVTNEFFRVCPSKRIIGVTGTKGKGTTSTLIAKMLEAAGKRVHLGGNIGIPPLTMLKAGIQPDDYVVLELANFQLIDLKYSPPLAVCLMVEPEHMDWHDSVEEYVGAKQQLFVHQSSEDIAVYYPQSELSRRVVSVAAGHRIPYMEEPGAIIDNDAVVIDGQEVCKTTELKLLGKHNWQNVCAAVTAAWQVTQDISALRSVLTSFTGLEHRLEFVREFQQVRYYDDSFGTTPETAIVAIEAFEEPKIVILGGSDKGSSYNKLAEAVKKSNVRKVVLIGAMAEKISQALQAVGYTDTVAGGETMTEIVSTAHQAAQPGDVVLLSTGCASFGLFKNYKDRGEQFKQAVQALA
jgi:UDP-N-acetylmuramoylalanine--D-glutamate ligase